MFLFSLMLPLLPAAAVCRRGSAAGRRTVAVRCAACTARLAVPDESAPPLPPLRRRPRQLAVLLLLLLAQRVQAALPQLLLSSQWLAGQQDGQDLVLVQVLRGKCGKGQGE